MGKLYNGKSFSAIDTWTEEDKTVHRLQKETLQSFVLANICYPVNTFVIFYAISIFKKVSVLINN